jgi:hypothetical protein
MGCCSMSPRKVTCYFTVINHVMWLDFKTNDRSDGSIYTSENKVLFIKLRSIRYSPLSDVTLRHSLTGSRRFVAKFWSHPQASKRQRSGCTIFSVYVVLNL